LALFEKFEHLGAYLNTLNRLKICKVPLDSEVLNHTKQCPKHVNFNGVENLDPTSDR